MLLQHFLVVATTFCFLLFMLGVYRITKEIEPNLCQMTYMFKNPQYTKIPFKKNYYGLYYYNEGNDRPDLKALNGAPVLFVPGNGGSYKQVRSLGSVALRMAMGYNKPHLDYFTIDYREELTALYGGYLAQQQHFLKQCINTILRLYRTNDKSLKRKIVIVGHSMGGVVAKSLLNEADWIKKVAVIIFISTPLERPVIYADKEIDNFYEQFKRLHVDIVSKDNADEVSSVGETSLGFSKNNTNLADILLISIGGGIRDNLVLAPFTSSRLNDVHAITTAIPHVWLSCDHLAAVWCLQLMKVTNKFLYEITFKAAEGFTYFNTNALLNLLAARHYFIGGNSDADVIKDTDTAVFVPENWTVTKTLSFYKIFEKGLKVDYVHAVFYEDVAPYEYIYIAVAHDALADHQTWLFGCQHNTCTENQMLTKQIKQLPSKRGRKTFALLNLAAIFGTFSSWTHLLIRLPASRHYAALYINVHNAEEVTYEMKAPHWFQMRPLILNVTTSTAPALQFFRKLQINSITEAFYALRLKIDCTNVDAKHGNDFETIVKIYAPWAAGFDRYYVLNSAQGASIQPDLLIQLPKEHFNVTKFNRQPTTLFIDMHTDPWCNLSLNYRYSLGDSMRNLAQQHYAAIFAHIALIVITNLAGQFHATHSSTKPQQKTVDFLQWKSWHCLIALRLATKAFLSLQIWLQQPLVFAKPSISSVPSLIVHGFAMATTILIALCIRAQLCVLRKIIGVVKIPTLTTTKWQIIFAIFAAAISLACSKGISLAFMYTIYMFMLAMANIAAIPSKLTKESSSLIENVVEEEKPQPKSKHQLQEKFTKILNTSEGLQNLQFHVVLLVLLLLMIAVNFGDTIAWFKSVFDYNTYHSIQSASSMLFTPVVFVICCLPLLWYYDAPANLKSSKYYALILYAAAAWGLLFCEEKFYRLNYVIASVFALLVIREILSKFK